MTDLAEIKAILMGMEDRMKGMEGRICARQDEQGSSIRLLQQQMKETFYREEQQSRALGEQQGCMQQLQISQKRAQMGAIKELSAEQGRRDGILDQVKIKGKKGEAALKNAGGAGDIAAILGLEKEWFDEYMQHNSSADNTFISVRVQGTLEERKERRKKVVEAVKRKGWGALPVTTWVERNLHATADKVLTCLQQHAARDEISYSFSYSNLFLRFHGKTVAYPLHLHYQQCATTEDLANSPLINMADPAFIFFHLQAEDQARRPPREEWFRPLAQWRHSGNWVPPAPAQNTFTPGHFPPPPHQDPRNRSPPQLPNSIQHVSQRQRTEGFTTADMHVEPRQIGLELQAAAPRFMSGQY
jgi:hypothetical protein